MGFIWQLLPAAEGRDRAGLHARADRRPGPSVLPLLHPVAAGEDHRGSSQQGAAIHSGLSDLSFMFDSGASEAESSSLRTKNPSSVSDLYTEAWLQPRPCHSSPSQVFKVEA